MPPETRQPNTNFRDLISGMIVLRNYPEVVRFPSCRTEPKLMISAAVEAEIAPDKLELRSFGERATQNGGKSVLDSKRGTVG